MFIEAISGFSVLAASRRWSRLMPSPPPVVMFTTASQPCLMRGRKRM